MIAARTALVTGATSGIGAATAVRLAREGAFVWVAGRDRERGQEVVERVVGSGRRAAFVELDVADIGSIEAAAALLRASGPVDWLVNGAGIAVSAPLVSRQPSGDDLYERHMRVNFHGARRAFEALLPGMLERSYGRVVNVASCAGFRGYAYVAAYAASKHALLGFTRSAAIELSAKGVAVCAVCPYYVDSPMTDQAVRRIAEKTGRPEAEARAFLAAQNPGGAFVTVEEVAEAVCDLLTGDLTGEIVELTGGASRTLDEGWPLGEASG